MKLQLRQRLRRLTTSFGMGAVVFALAVQGLGVLFPATTHAAVDDPNDNVIYQGAANKADLLAIYDKGVDAAGHADIKAIYSHFGVTRQDLVNATEGTYYTDDQGGRINSVGRLKYDIPGRSAVAITGTNTTVYSGPFSEGYNHIHYPMKALIGQRAVDGAWFAITLDCGNIVYTKLPPKPVKNISVCRPGTGVITIKETERKNTDVPVDNTACKADIQVCRPDVGVVTIKEDKKRSTDLPVNDAACQPKPVTPVEVKKVTVCRPGTGIVTINESDKLSTDLPKDDAACQPKPAAPVTLPKTGPGEMLLSAAGLGLLAAAGYFYYDSRRALGRTSV